MRPSELEQVARTRAGLTSGDARRAREAAGVSAAEVGRVVGVSRMAVSHWERGAKRPTDRHALAYGRLLAALGNRGGAS